MALVIFPFLSMLLKKIHCMRPWDKHAHTDIDSKTPQCVQNGSQRKVFWVQFSFKAKISWEMSFGTGPKIQKTFIRRNQEAIVFLIFAHQ